METSGIILAGGKSLRLGYDKVLETVGNRSLLQLVVSGVTALTSEIVIVAVSEPTIPQFTERSKLRIVTDIYPGKGTLGGIYTGLVVSDSLCNLIVACDMPFLNYDLLHYMIQLSPSFDVVVPRLGNMVEPLHAVYSKDCLGSVEYLLKQGNLSVTELFTLVRVRYVEAEEIDRFDPKHLSFFNINTEADLNMARELVKDSLTALDK